MDRIELPIAVAVLCSGLNLGCGDDCACSQSPGCGTTDGGSTHDGPTGPEGSEGGAETASPEAADVGADTATPDAGPAHSGGFPRTAIFQWGGAPVEWYAKFDLVMTRIADKDFIAAARSLNPKLIWLPARDFNKADESYGIANKDFPEEWFLHKSTGSQKADRITLYSDDSFWADFSDLCTPVGGETLGVNYTSLLGMMVDDSGADGLSSDGIYSSLHLTYNMFADVDLDHNSQNDLGEQGKGKDWVIDHWSDGVEDFLDKLRARVGDKIIMLNSGSPDMPGQKNVNGYVGENTGGALNWGWTLQHYTDAAKGVRAPKVFLMNVPPDGNNPTKVSPAKNDYVYMRFGLGRAMLLGHYFEFEDLDAHYWNKYYDEFDADVGEATSDPVQLTSTGPTGEGVWVRFFDRGVVVVNVDGKDTTVSDADLAKQSAFYHGPYFRLKGGQTPTFNTGAVFDQVSLKGSSKDAGGLMYLYGDAILLTTTPTTVVSDVVVDNSDSGTSPGSTAAQLSGGFQQRACKDGGGYYSLRCAEWYQSYGFASTQAGSGEKAVFAAGIGVAGKYEVFEWHGHVGDSATATTEGRNVPHVLKHDGGETVVKVDQSVGEEKWNSLGVFHLSPGVGSVTITNEADGEVMADAIKFVFLSGD